MIGQGRPIVRSLYRSARLAMRTCCWPKSTALLIALAWGMLASTGVCEELNVRLRLAWGSGDSAKHRWVGQISCANATLSDVQPLGIEPDAPAAIQLVDNTIVVSPWEERGFDGCDVTIAGEDTAVVRFELRSEQSSTPTIVEVPLKTLAKEQVREPIDALGSVLLAYRSPGDRFRLVPAREHLIFGPGETWSLRARTDFAAELTAGPVTVDIALRAIGSDAILWQARQVITAASPSPELLAVEITCPTAEGAYRLSLNASAEQSFATRFVPGQGSKPFAVREIDLVVIDPAAKLPALVDKWVPVLSIDPANPGWWQRLPTWAQVSRLTGKPPGTLGNVRLLPRPGDANGLVELAPSATSSDPTWQSFALPIQDVGVPHLIEISYPLAEKQHIGVSIIEPDAAGRVTTAVLDSGFHVDEIIEATPGQIGTHRIVFWPRTQSPQLLVVNRHESLPAVFGRIVLLRHNNDQSPPPLAESSPSNRLVAGYIAKPVFAQNFGAAEVLDPVSGMSVQTWSTFLDGAHRLTQYLKLSGYTGALVSVAADGSALYPSEHLAPSPRYDTGMLAASGQDPLRKDVLEMLLRVCDREGTRVVPTLQLASPLPRIERLRCQPNGESTGLVWTDAQGRQLIQVRRNNLAANYNLLDPRVQDEVAAVVKELVDRCTAHSAFAGVALQLDSNGYGVLPGLEWGFDDQTVAAFSADTGIQVPTSGENRYAERAAMLLDEHRADWQAWRIKKVTAFYRGLAEQVLAHRDDLRLILTTENLFAEATLEQAVRRSVSQPERLKELLAERGIDLEVLAAIRGVEVTNAQHVSEPESLQERVVDLVVNEASQQRNLSATAASLCFQTVGSSRLASFDQQSPFGTTHLVLAHLPSGNSSLAHVAGVASGAFIEGGDYLRLTLNADHARQLRSLAQMPTNISETRVVSEQPLDIRVARTADETHLICANTSPWSIAGRLELEASNEAVWQYLGAEHPATGQSGRLGAGRSHWPLELEPHDVQIWKFASPDIRVGELHTAANPAVRNYLAGRIEEIEARTGNLNIERDYTQLQNPGFELEDGGVRIFGWQPRKGVDGAVEIENAKAHGGQRSLRLKSVDSLGVAAQSHLFPLPETGMLLVTAQVRADGLSDNALLTMAVETDEQGQFFRRARSIALGEEFSSQWKQCELVVSDLPVGEADQIRVQFHVTGKADLLLDDVALCDLRFDDQRRSELVKRVFAAKTALEEEQYTDCLRLLNEYWPQYLVEYVPPLVREPTVLAKQPEKIDTKPAEEKTKGGRFRNIIPRIWR